MRPAEGWDTGSYAMTNRSLNPSLSQRLLLAAAAFLIVALIVSGWIIDGILNTFVSGQIEKRLDGQILALASAVSVQENLPLFLSVI